ncbi:MAG: phage baseplate protein [Vampirovibrio sp.]
MGMNRQIGTSLNIPDHIRQSVGHILTTPLGSRVMNRAYGSQLFQLTDAPMNASTKLKMIAASADALAKWEPRISVNQVSVKSDETGKATINVSAEILANGQPINIQGVQVR